MDSLADLAAFLAPSRRERRRPRAPAGGAAATRIVAVGMTLSAARPN